MVIVKVVFFCGFVLVFNLLNSIKFWWLIFFKIDMIFVICEEKVFKFCLIDCLFLIFVNIFVKIFILFFFLIGIGNLVWFINCKRFNVFRVMVFLLVLGFVIIIVWYFFLIIMLLVIVFFGFNSGCWVCLKIIWFVWLIFGIIVFSFFFSCVLVLIKLSLLMI